LKDLLVEWGCRNGNSLLSLKYVLVFLFWGMGDGLVEIQAHFFEKMSIK
jgi:hypothetical protein